MKPPAAVPSRPSYINDIAQSNMEYIADISRERVRFRGNGYLPSQTVESARGSKDAFYIKIDKHYGSSDHVTYMQHGILPGAGGLLDQDEALWNDIRLCLAMLGDAMEQNGETRKDWLAQLAEQGDPVGRGGATLDLW